jgi:hypothetical protein
MSATVRAPDGTFAAKTALFAARKMGHRRRIC